MKFLIFALFVLTIFAQESLLSSFLEKLLEGRLMEDQLYDQFGRPESDSFSPAMDSYGVVATGRLCGTAGEHFWFNEYNLGLEGCYQRVLADDRCKLKTPFMYADSTSDADNNCGCAAIALCVHVRNYHVNLYEPLRSYNCQVGQGAFGEYDSASHSNSESSCAEECSANFQCVGFDYTTKSKFNACRLYSSGSNTPRLDNGGGNNRQYCAKLVFTCGGNADGAPCSFPFEYRSNTYTSCISIRHSRAWCYTTNSGKWGNCHCNGEPGVVAGKS